MRAQGSRDRLNVRRRCVGWASVRDVTRECRAQAVQFRLKEASSLNLWKRYATRRHRKNHERIEAERARQKALAAQDVQEVVRDAAQGSAVAQQGAYGQSQP